MSDAKVGDWSTRKNDDPNVGEVGREYPFLVIGSAEDAHQGYVFTEKGMSLVTNYNEDQPAQPAPDGSSSVVPPEPKESRADFEARIRAEALRDAQAEIAARQEGNNQ